MALVPGHAIAWSVRIDSTAMHSAYELLQKYSRPAPRYTSYPTAPVFCEGFRADDYTRLLGGADRSERPLSLYFHIPFCRNICYFCACTVVYTANQKRSAPYLALLAREMDLVTDAMSGERDARGRLLRPVKQLHFGGGTPSFARPEEILSLGERIRERFTIADDAEISVELDPRATTPEHVEAFTRSGFNRASLGVQDLNPAVQQAINRIQPFAQVQKLVRDLRERGFRGINVDLMYGLPLQTPAGFARTLDATLALRPDRISLFHFAYLPELKRHQQRMDARTLPGTQERLEIFAGAVEQLKAAGYVYIGMDHFALPEDPLAVAQAAGRLHRNFQGYTLQGDAAGAEWDLLAFGLSAIGDLRNAYVQNTRDMKQYAAAISAGQLPVERGLLLNADDIERRRIIMQLICHFSLDFDAEFRRRYTPEFEALRNFEAEGLLVVREAPGGGGRLEISEAGKFVVRNICAVFDVYQAELAARGQRFSKSV